MEESIVRQPFQPDVNRVSRKKIAILVAIIAFLISIVAVGAYYVGKNTVEREIPIDKVTPTTQAIPTNQITPTTYISPQIDPTEPVSQCTTDSQCGSQCKRCVNGACTTINGCNPQEPQL